MFTPGQKTVSPATLAQSQAAIDTGGATVAKFNMSGGVVTANGTSAVVVANANVTANSVVVFTLKNLNAGTPAGAPYLSAVTPGTGFSIKAAAGDTGIYSYLIIG